MFAALSGHPDDDVHRPFQASWSSYPRTRPPPTSRSPSYGATCVASPFQSSRINCCRQLPCDDEIGIQFPDQARREWLRLGPGRSPAPSPQPQDGQGHTEGYRAMPNDHRPELPTSPELTIDEGRNLARRAVVETAEAKAKCHDLIRETQDLLKRVDEILAGR